MDVRLSAVTLIVPSETTFAAARSIGANELGTLHALHLAAAAELASDLEAVVTYDRRLAAACERELLRVATPGLPSGWWHGS